MQAFSKNHLTLRLKRLHPAEDWTGAGDGLSFLMLTGGEGKYAVGETSWDLLPGDVMVLNAEAGGRVQAEEKELVLWFFSVRFEHLFPLFSTEEIPLLRSISERFKTSRLYSAATPVAQECQRLVQNAPPEGNVDHRSHMLRIAAVVLSAEFADARTEHGVRHQVSNHRIRRFESLVPDQLLSMSVGELAGKFRCSRRHLNRLFHQHFGFSASALRMELRLLKAVSLLRDRDRKIIHVAEKCGFNHLGLFNTCFKKRFGLSPGKWRKAHGDNSLGAPNNERDHSSALEDEVHEMFTGTYAYNAIADYPDNRLMERHAAPQ